MTAPYAVAVHYGLLRADGMDSSGRPDIAGLQWPGVFAAMYAWRQGRGIYRYDAELAEAVAASDLPSDIGTDMLFRLPEWGAYIDPAGALGDTIVGFWVHLSWDVASECAELRFVWDTAPDDGGGGSLEILPVPLGHASLAAAMDAAMDNANIKAARAGLTDGDLHALDGPADFNFDLIRRAVLLVLYLCTDDADVSSSYAAADDRGALGSRLPHWHRTAGLASSERRRPWRKSRCAGTTSASSALAHLLDRSQGRPSPPGTQMVGAHHRRSGRRAAHFLRHALTRDGVSRLCGMYDGLRES